MKRPYIRKFSDISGFNVWIVDGKYIRDNINVEFTNYAQHYQFDFIPQDEFWIDRSRISGEEKYYIASMLLMIQLMTHGVSHAGAYKIADDMEKRSRMKDFLAKKEISAEEAEQKKIELVHKKLFKKYSKNLNVWIVDGNAVRTLFFTDFTQGGHEKAYSFIPKNEIWIDDALLPSEIKVVLLHELHERKIMFEKGINYDVAHEDSSKLESYYRHHPETIETAIKENMEIANKKTAYRKVPIETRMPLEIKNFR